MGTFALEGQGTNTILVYTLDEEEMLDSLTVGMMANNKVEGVISPGFVQQNEMRQLKYNLSSDISLKEYFDGEIKKKQLIRVLKSLTKTLLGTEKYLQKEDDFLLDWQYIYVNLTNLETELLSFPVVQEQKVKIDFYGFIRRLMNDIKFDESEDGRYAITLMNYTKKRDSFSLRGFLGVLDQVQTEQASVKQDVKQQVTAPVVKVEHNQEPPVRSTERRVSMGSTAPVKPVVSPVLNTVKEEKQPVKKKLFGRSEKKKKKTGMSIPNQNRKPETSNVVSNMRIPNVTGMGNGYGTAVSAEQEKTGTTVLEAANQQSTVSITQIRSGRKMNIQKASFRIGKQNADFCIADNHTVSRNHADILVMQDGVYIRDNNSLNHTYVNEQIVPAGGNRKLEDGDILRLSDEKFVITVSK